LRKKPRLQRKEEKEGERHRNAKMSIKKSFLSNHRITNIRNIFQRISNPSLKPPRSESKRLNLLLNERVRFSMVN